MEIVAKENVVTVMDHMEGRRSEEIAEDPLVIPRRIMEKWRPQLIDELPEAFCGMWNRLLILITISLWIYFLHAATVNIFNMKLLLVYFS